MSTGALILALAPASAIAQTPNFGGAVAISGGDVFVGYSGDTGKSGIVKVYNRIGDEWEVVAELSAGDATGQDDRFGRALYASGDLLVAGATTRDELRGGAYVFERSGGSWSQTALLLPEETEPGTTYGRSVASNGSVVLVGAAGYDSASGVAYVYARDASGAWAEQARLRPDGLVNDDLFGLTIAFDGSLALVTALKEGNGPGDVYAYHYDAAGGAWHELGKLPAPPDVGAQAAYGISLGISGNHALVGAPGQDGGQVYTFRYDAAAGGWQFSGALARPDGGPGNGFGASVFMTDGGAFVGAPGVNSGGGAVYPYRLDEESMTWVAGDRVEATGKMSSVAAAISVDGNTAAFGMPGADYGLGRAAILRYDEAGLGWIVEAELFDEVETLASVTGGEVRCDGGDAAGFNCQRVDLLSFLSLPDMGGERGIRLNDIWGWTDPETEREYALVGRTDGTSFVDVTDPHNPVYLGNLPKTPGSTTNAWRDLKVYSNHVFIVADGAGDHGMQVFDLTQLRNVQNAPVTFEESAHYDGIASAHNIVINEDTGFAYTVGGNSGGETCGGGSHIIDIRDPLAPTFAGCFAHDGTGRTGTGYTHDAQCVVYQGPDTDFAGREVCFGSNETALSIADLSDKANPVTLSATTYPNVGYAHQGWLTEDHRYFLLDDELDELSGLVVGTRTLIWDVSDLEDPQLIKEFVSDDTASDHNLYVKGDFVYQSNYVSGLRIMDISDINNPVMVGHFDTVVGEDAPGFDGSWSNYPFFKSGTIVVTSGAEGLFVVRKSDLGL
jgi:choice-of-anchor B domain-containing protein